MKGINLYEYAKYVTLGVHIAASMIVPVVIGIYMDNRFDMSPFGVIIGALLGFGALISIVLKLAAENTGKKKDHSNDNL